MNYLKLIRYQNLLLIAIMQLIVRFSFLEQINIPLSLFYWQYTLLIVATVLIAAGGYIINDIFDLEIDTINKPNQVIVGKNISENHAYILYAVLTILGVACGFILANTVAHPNLAVLFVLIATLLYFYASTLKKIAVLGNIVVALLIAFSVLIIGIFDIYPNTFEVNRNQMYVAFSILLDYAVFAFIINFIREIVKDLEDVLGDKQAEYQTLPNVIGISKTCKILFVLIIGFIGYVLHYCNTFLMQNDLYYATIYIFLTVVAPLLFCAIKIINAREKSEFYQLSNVLKWILFFGILSITVINFNVNHNA